MWHRKKLTPLLAVLFLIINLVIFTKTLSRPVLWQQGELTNLHFFWSLNNAAATPQKAQLRTGLHFNDFSKIVSSEEYDYQFRPRHFSFFCSMLIFKLLQFLKIVTFHDPLLIFWHILNTFLVYGLVRRLTGSISSALLSAMLCLNSGVALSTLQYPHFGTKILVCTLFLACWHRLIPKKNIQPNDSRSHKNIFFAIFLFLGLLTDEYIVLTFPLLILYATISHWPKKRTLGQLGLVFLLTVTMAYIANKFFFLIDAQLGDGVAIFPLKEYLINILLAPMAKTSQFLHDILLAAGAYFLRRNFGYWDSTIWGALSLVSFSILVVVAWKSRPSVSERFIVFLILLTIIMKAVLVPHLWGVHPHVMPPGTIFACLLFFNHKYTYIDMLLLVILLGILFPRRKPRAPGSRNENETVLARTENNRELSQNEKIKKGPYWPISWRREDLIPLVFVLVLIINSSNAIHAKEGIQDTLDNQGYYLSHQNAIPHILAIKNILPLTSQGPIYLSFPSGNNPTFYRKARGKSIWQFDPEAYRNQLNPFFMNYCSIIPVKFLRWFENGDLIMSLKNIKYQGSIRNNQVIERARYFYDVPGHYLIDLEKLRRSATGGRLTTNKMTSSSTVQITFTPAQDKDEICYLVKGAALLQMKAENKTVFLRQRYGYSFQMLKVSAAELLTKERQVIEFEIIPISEGYPIEVIGPFFLTKT